MAPGVEIDVDAAQADRIDVAVELAHHCDRGVELAVRPDARDVELFAQEASRCARWSRLLEPSETETTVFMLVTRADEPLAAARGGGDFLGRDRRIEGAHVRERKAAALGHRFESR